MSDPEKQQANMTVTHMVDHEKASSDHKSLTSDSGTGSKVDLTNYYEEKAGSLVVDPE